MQRSTQLLSVVFASLTLSAAAQVQGPSSSQPPYMLPVAAGVQTVSLLTVGDNIGGYRLVGIPDGMGARKLPNGRLELTVNHELGQTAGVVRAHGATGAFLSTWQIDAANYTVYSGADVIQNVNFVNGTNQLGRFCSGDLPLRKSFWLTLNPVTSPFVFMSGEEIGANGRAFAHVLTGPEAGQSYELPWLGKCSWENVVARPYKQRITVVAGMDDSTPGQIYIYVGNKKRIGNVPTRAGLNDGNLYGVRVPGAPLEDRTNGINGATTFEMFNLGDVSAMNGNQIQAASVAGNVTQFLRPEDGAWDENDPRDFYFVTTDRFNTPTSPGRSRLWRLRFASVTMPELGGTIDMLLDGTEGQQMFDNLCLDQRGNVLLQEDPGNQAYLAKVWQYNIATDTLTTIAEHDPAFFLSGGANFLTQDEECSGIFDASAQLGPGWFILNTQAHYSIPGELVEGGQLLALFNPDSL